MSKFIISTDSSSDFYKSTLRRNNIYCIVMKRIIKGKEVSELYDSVKEVDSFYETLKKGALPSTVAINPFELQEQFESILKSEPKGDIIHVGLSSGLSATYENAMKAAEEVNKKLTGRKVCVVDSLHATAGLDMIIDELLRLRDSGASVQESIKRIEQLRDNQQTWVYVSDLFHLKRGGRISGAKAAIGSILNIRPIIVVSKSGKLAIENKIRGTQTAINYVLEKMEEGSKVTNNFKNRTIYLVRTSQSKCYDDFKDSIKKRFPDITIKESVMGPIIGTHVGCGAWAVVFESTPRLDIS